MGACCTRGSELGTGGAGNGIGMDKNGLECDWGWLGVKEDSDEIDGRSDIEYSGEFGGDGKLLCRAAASGTRTKSESSCKLSGFWNAAMSSCRSVR